MKTIKIILCLVAFASILNIVGAEPALPAGTRVTASYELWGSPSGGDDLNITQFLAIIYFDKDSAAIDATQPQFMISYNRSDSILDISNNVRNSIVDNAVNGLGYVMTTSDVHSFYEILQVSEKSDAPNYNILTSYGNTFPNAISGRRALGNASFPLAVTPGIPLLNIYGGGYTGYYFTDVLAISTRAAETWTNTSHPTQIVLYTNNGTGALNGWAITASRQLVPTVNATQDIGAPSLRVKTLYTKTNVVGDIDEEYTYNHSFNYSIGDGVSVDNDSNDIKLSEPNSTKLVGVVVRLPYNETLMDGNELQNATVIFHDVLTVAILGKVDAIKVNGTIKKGDSLMSAGNGVAESFYNKTTYSWEYNFTSSKVQKWEKMNVTCGTDPDRYNRCSTLNANTIDTFGIAMANYNSSSIGYIPVLIGKG